MTANASVQRRSPYLFTEEDIEFLRRKSAEHAISFLQDVRQYKEQKGLTDVPDIHFSRKFLDETMVLLEQDCAATPPSPKRRFTDIFPFKRKRDLRHAEEKQEKPGRAALPRGQSDPLLLDSKEVLLIGPLKVLDWSDSAKPKRIPCKLVLLVEMGIHKLEVYIPPKSSRPKTCIFCFLIEEVRATTDLESPGIETRFVVKAKNGTEYVFEADEPDVKKLWLDNLQQVLAVEAVNQEMGLEVSMSLNNSLPESAMNPHMLSCPILAGNEDEPVSATPAGLTGNASPRKSTHNKQKRFSFGGFFGHKHEGAQVGQEDSVTASVSSRVRSQSTAADFKIKKGKVSSTSDLSSSATRGSLTHLTVPSLVSPVGSAQALRQMEAKDKRKMSLPTSVSSSVATDTDRLTDRRSSGAAAMILSHEDLSNTSTDLVDIRELVKGLDLQQLARSHSEGTNQQRQEAEGNSHSNASSPGRERRGSFEFEITPSPTSLSPVQDNGGLSSPREVTNGQFPTSASPSESPTFVEGLDPLAQLAREPWYHGLLLRSDCSRLLQSLGHNATGRFLVRKSESVNGEYVLSFNFQGRAKHLRMSVNPNGSCQMQHLSFSRVSEMLDYFKHHPIPLESTSMYGDIMLTDHVPSNESADVRADYDAFQQARSNASLRGRAQSFTATSISDPPHLTLRINGRPISRATENIYIRT